MMTAEELEQDNRELREIVDSLSRRVFAQSELLSRLAERGRVGQWRTRIRCWGQGLASLVAAWGLLIVLMVLVGAAMVLPHYGIKIRSRKEGK
jgi:hypothetical protein